MSAFAIPLFFDNTPGSSTPLRVAAPSYTNESSTAQSSPYANPYKVLKGTGVNVLDAPAPGDALTPAATPANPAAPSPKDTASTVNDKQKDPTRSPLLWIGIAAGALALFWAVRHA